MANRVLKVGITIFWGLITKSIFFVSSTSMSSMSFPIRGAHVAKIPDLSTFTEQAKEQMGITVTANARLAHHIAGKPLEEHPYSPKLMPDDYGSKFESEYIKQFEGNFRKDVAGRYADMFSDYTTFNNPNTARFFSQNTPRLDRGQEFQALPATLMRSPALHQQQAAITGPYRAGLIEDSPVQNSTHLVRYTPQSNFLAPLSVHPSQADIVDRSKNPMSRVLPFHIP